MAPIALSRRRAVWLDIAVWAVWGTTVGYLGSRLPASRLRNDTWLTALRPEERDGRLYERLHIRRWKGRLPEAGGLFGSGVSKRHLRGRDEATLVDFVAETRRAELVHWVVPAVWPVFMLWNEPPLLAAMAVYALAANLPCLLVQRYNRARLMRLLQSREEATRRHAARSQAMSPA